MASLGRNVLSRVFNTNKTLVRNKSKLPTFQDSETGLPLHNTIGGLGKMNIHVFTFWFSVFWISGLTLPYMQWKAAVQKR